MNSQNRTLPTGPSAKDAQDQALPTVPASESNLTPDENKVLKQSMNQDELRALQEGAPNTNKAVQQSMEPRYPVWPISRPGPLATPPPPGQRPINAIRSEQVVEVGYNQATGEPSTQDPSRSLPDASKGAVGFDQQELVQEAHKKGKERL